MYLDCVLYTIFPKNSEIILISVDDEQTLLLAQRVCRRWARCIQASRALQQALFYQPTQSALPNTTIPQPNALLAATFPYRFPNDDQKSRNISFRAGGIQEFLDKHAAWLHPSTSWRRMLVQQPPRNWEPSFEEYGRLRMNMIYDLVVKSFDGAAAFFYWRMHCSYPGLESPSIRGDPDI
ncbi:uncharacterized protein N7500_005616 [Penicillium coprophilum]|uniref:uncharacterized protein n=1 Tax=Penicillium coprophilum TaxID=36646 RepID=UPI0023A772B8|nr:uncharacterized protein N7500_005616 [Penicillium coprophilum]KAJ5163786.1 hypothetical protein N7500_005616 [Penicillium coprophilum]